MGNLPADNAVEVLPDEQMVVPVEDHADVIPGKQLMDWHRPARPVRCKTIAAVRAGAPPFVALGCFGAASSMV